MKVRLFTYAIMALFILGSFNSLSQVTDESILGKTMTHLGLSSETRTDPNLVAHWSMDEGTGNSIGDASGNSNHGMLNLGTEGNTNVANVWVGGINGKGLEFDGVDDYVDCGNDATLNITNKITIEAWVKRNEQSRIESIVSKGPYSLKIGPDNKPFIELITGSETIADVGRLGSNTRVYSLAVYDGKLYGGTHNSGKVYRYDGGTTWIDVGRLGSNSHVWSLTVYNDKLYGGTQETGRVYRYDGGTTWTDVGQLGSNNRVLSLAVYDGKLYGGTWDSGRVYRYDGGTTWTDIGRLGTNDEVWSLIVYNGELYGGAAQSGRIYRYDGGTTWIDVGQLGSDTHVFSLVVYNGNLYGGTYGGRVFRYDGGNNWVNVGRLGTNLYVHSLAVYNGNLYAGAGEGGRIYRYNGPLDWTDVGQLGTNTKVRSLAVYDGKLFGGTMSSGKVYSIGSGLAAYSNTALGIDEFAYVSGTYDGNAAKIYVNSEETGIKTGTITIDTEPFNLLIGSSRGSSKGGTSSSGEENFNGMVDEVTIHNKALSTDEVKQNYDKILESQHIEETEFGGRWFDEFIDGTGIERNENISVDNGAAELDRGEFSIEGCVGYWNFDEGSGNTAHDTSGKGIDGTLMNMDNNDWVDGVNGTALEFDGGDDYIDLLEGDNILGISRDFSIGCYIRPDSVGTGSQAILDLNYQSTNDNRGNGILLFLAPDSKVSVCLYLADDADGKLYRIKGNSVLQSSEIYHVAVTRNMNDMRIYLNGVEDGNGVVSGSDVQFTYNVNGHVGDFNTIGTFRKQQGTQYYRYDGLMDELSIYDRSLTANEISYLFAAFASPPVGLWHFDEGTGNVAADSSGNANDGTLENMNNNDWVNGVLGKALEFDGSNDRVDIVPDWDFNDMAVSFWMKDTGESGQAFFSLRKAEGAGSGGTNGGVHFHTKYSGSPSDTDLWWRDTGGQQLRASTDWDVNVFDGNWHNLIMNKQGKTLKLYRDGIEIDVDSNQNIGSIDNMKALWLGADCYSGGRYYFSGTLDEFRVYDRALTQREIDEHQNLIYGVSDPFHVKGSVRSRNITLPENMTWNTFQANRSVPDNTYLNISVHDTITGEMLAEDTGDTEEIFIDLSSIDDEEHGMIYLTARFQSNITHTPELHNWSVSWSLKEEVFESPTLTQSLPPILYVTEDTPEDDLLDLSQYFLDPYSGIAPSTYAVEYNSDDVNVTLELSGSNLNVAVLAENWTGIVYVTVNCTNVLGLSTPSNLFGITVVGVEDKPAWISTPPSISFDEDSNHTTDFPLSDYIFDAEGDELQYIAETTEDRITVKVDLDTHITIIPEKDYFGESEITVFAREIRYQSLSTITLAIPVTVNPVNDLPAVELQSPADGLVIAGTTVTLKWTAFDSDDEISNITYDLYFSDSPSPSIFASDIDQNTRVIPDLIDGSPYFWYVIPHDGKDYGHCRNGTWRFTINTGLSLPEITLMTPEKDTILTTTEILLTWDIYNPSGNDVTFTVHLGTSPDDLKALPETPDTQLKLSGLEDKTTYYWKVEADVDGFPFSFDTEIWSFSILGEFKATHEVVLLFEMDEVEIERGESKLVNLTMKNLGNVKEQVNLTISGDLLVSMDKTFILSPKEEKTINVNIFAESKLELKTYDLTVEASFSGKRSTASISVKVKDDSKGIPKDPKKESWTWFIIGVILFLMIIGLLIFIVLRRQKRDGTGKPDALRAEIESHPTPGINRADLDRLSLSDPATGTAPSSGHISEIPLHYKLPSQHPDQFMPLTPREAQPTLKGPEQGMGEPKTLPYTTMGPEAEKTLQPSAPDAPLLPSPEMVQPPTSPEIHALPMVATVSTRPLSPTTPPPELSADPVPERASESLRQSMMSDVATPPSLVSEFFPNASARGTQTLSPPPQPPEPSQIQQTPFPSDTTGTQQTRFQSGTPGSAQVLPPSPTTPPQSFQPRLMTIDCSGCDKKFVTQVSVVPSLVNCPFCNTEKRIDS